MRVLITGSSGMIGTNLALRLQPLGHEVLGVDIRPNPWSREVGTRVIDLTRGDALAGVNWPADLVVHLAAHAKVHASVVNPALAIENIAMAASALEYARARGCPVLLGSSREVYGDTRRTSTGERTVFIDSSASPYSASKLAVEALGHSYRRCYGLPVAVLRFSNVYGRYDCDLERMERVVALFIHRIARSEAVTVFGKEKRLDFTYIDDCVSGIVLSVAALADGRLDGHAVNIASGTGSSLGELAVHIGRALGIEPRVQYSARRPGEITRYVARLEVARKHLGYSPAVFLAEGVSRAVLWQLEHGWLAHAAGARALAA
jgi:nucleoside-diphosphate-sugar epimerase